MIMGIPVAAAALVLAIVSAGALGASGPTTTATFTGTSGTVSVGGVLYAKNGGAITLRVTTSAAQCVDVSGAFTGHQTADSDTTQWTFPYTAGTGDGVQTVLVSAYNKHNGNGVCTGPTTPVNAAFTLDNTGPTVSATRTPAANGAGWNNSNVGLTWTASDPGGSGVASGPTPATASFTANTPATGTQATASATDRLGNSGTGSITVKLDKTLPDVSVVRSPSANANGWNNSDVTASVTCSDALSGIAACTGGGTKTFTAEGANQSLNATATDNADNSRTTTVNNINIDKTAPTLSGAVAGGTAGDDGWYRSDVTIHWTCSDALSGIDGACPADSTITGEGQNRSASASVSDQAGNATTAQSPVVKIDQTAPNTDASAVDAWNRVDVTVALTPHDALSGVATTRYRIDDGDVQTGTQVAIASEGKHTLEYWSVDRAGNAEAHKTVAVNIDKTSPTITHAFDPAPNGNGWNRGDVDVTFTCADDLSGIESCGPDRVVSQEGAGLDASGTARDRAGNTTADPATVSIDRTAPTVAAHRDRAANGDGWYDDDVTVSFTCGDALSGVDHCPAPRTLGEGADQSVSGEAADAAGNTATDGIDHINIDKTAPTLNGAPTTAPGADGWYAGDVTVAWTCHDDLSGLKGDCPADSTIGGEGGNLSASATVADRAGNVAQATVDGIKIDRTAPSTSADVPAPLDSGWYAGAVKVALQGDDALSGVARTYYRVDDGDAQVYDAAFSFDQKGTHTITFWSVDVAGNVENRDAPGHAITLKIDGVPPTITGHRTPDANTFGWTNTDVTVSFECSDAESGIAGCDGPVTMANEGADQSITGNAIDNAGNTNSATVDHINIDKTAPTLEGHATSEPNAATWYTGDVTVHWTGADGLSGIDDSTVPGDTVVDGEGRDLAAGPVTVSDKAGNTASATVGGIKIDRTPPVITGAPKSDPGNGGWYRGDVVVGFSCTDALSGVAQCPSDKVVTGNGADRSVTSDPAVDIAGNAAPGMTVGGIKIDGLAPQTKADNQCVKANDWCTGSTATVVLKATDQDGLSGVKEIHYSINGGDEQVVDGADATVTVPLNGSGEATVRYYAVDVAGNQEPVNGVSLKYDNIAPTLTHSVSPTPNAEAWNHEDLTVHFSASDNDGGSGVDASTVTPDVTVSDETAGKEIQGEALDLAGNRGTDKVTVKLDKTAPAVSGAIVSGQRGDGGWYVGPVTVHFTCSDALSGVAVCPDDITLTDNAAGQSATGTAIDHAGNRATATVSGIDIDRDRPALTLAGIADGAIYTLGAVPTASCKGQDSTSGIASCTVSVTGGRANGVGAFSFTATATDKAGNTTTQTGTYRVIYRFDGFLQPINDTAHQIGVATSIFKAGSTVPAKFQLKRADGTVVAANDLPAWEIPVKGSPTTAAVQEGLYGAAADSGSTFRWSASDQQYMYNWNTAAGDKGYYQRLGVRLDDGQQYYVNIGLR
jgi:hypothetical protein